MASEFVLVAGASGDVGRAIAVELAAAGADLLMIGRDPRKLASIHIPGSKRRVRSLAIDLTDPAAVRLVQADVAREGRLDALILSSGVYRRSDDPDMLRQQVDANLLGPYALLRGVLHWLIKSRGQVVFINSSQGLRATAGVGQYAATKHAMRAIADSLRDEANEHGVRVTSLYLGRIAGALQRDIFRVEGRPYAPEMLIQPHDVARMVGYILQLPRTIEVTDLTMRTARRA
jgi:NADP-dependent 3-hydroxy acid dehydrogenase YdfG